MSSGSGYPRPRDETTLPQCIPATKGVVENLVDDVVECLGWDATIGDHGFG